mmetsp:Transcript_20233/g.56384  ORF Transcript_20233/g.56384 Transcript_20233/m.56384 type:complete len:221 (-) Transcript_20233:402-1064(-)
MASCCASAACSVPSCKRTRKEGGHPIPSFASTTSAGAGGAPALGKKLTCAPGCRAGASCASSASTNRSCSATMYLFPGCTHPTVPFSTGDPSDAQNKTGEPCQNRCTPEADGVAVSKEAALEMDGGAGATFAPAMLRPDRPSEGGVGIVNCVDMDWSRAAKSPSTSAASFSSWVGGRGGRPSRSAFRISDALQAAYFCLLAMSPSNSWNWFRISIKKEAA